MSRFFGRFTAKGGCALSCPLGEAREGEQLVARFLQAISDGLALQASLADESLALRLDLLLRADVDHILVIGGKFVMQPIGSMSEKVAMLMRSRLTMAHYGRDIRPKTSHEFTDLHVAS